MGVFVVPRPNASDGTQRFHVRWQRGRNHPQVHLGSFTNREEAEARAEAARYAIASGDAVSLQALTPARPERPPQGKRRKASKRRTIGNRLRFAILERDAFTCQYCGRSAPDVALEIDHVQPVSLGGSNHEDNLVTACRDCNAGKHAREVQLRLLHRGRR